MLETNRPANFFAASEFLMRNLHVQRKDRNLEKLALLSEVKCEARLLAHLQAKHMQKNNVKVA